MTARIEGELTMRIVVHGQQAFGKAVLEALLKRGENVDCRLCRAGKGRRQGRSAEGSRARRQTAGLSAGILQRSSKVWEEFKALKPDLQVMAFVTLFVPEDFLNIPTHGSIQYHPSLLPAYRGASAINWPIIKGEKETGPVDLLARQRARYRRRPHAEENADLGRPTRSAPSISTGCSRWASRR